MNKKISLHLSTLSAAVDYGYGGDSLKLILNSPDNNAEFFIEFGDYNEFIDFLITAREYCLHSRKELNRGNGDKPSGGYPF